MKRGTTSDLPPPHGKGPQAVPVHGGAVTDAARSALLRKLRFRRRLQGVFTSAPPSPSHQSGVSLCGKNESYLASSSL